MLKKHFDAPKCFPTKAITRPSQIEANASALCARPSTVEHSFCDIYYYFRLYTPSRFCNEFLTVCGVRDLEPLDSASSIIIRATNNPPRAATPSCPRPAPFDVLRGAFVGAAVNNISKVYVVESHHADVVRKKSVQIVAARTVQTCTARPG